MPTIRPPSVEPGGPDAAGRACCLGGWRGTAWWAWAEARAHGRMLLGFLVAWLAVVWFLPLVVHPLWILAHGLAYAVVAGPAVGGADVIRGCEEFAFAGPLTRGQRYLGRLVLGMVTVLGFTAMGVVALAGNLSDVLLRVFVSSAPAALELEQSLTWNGLAWALPWTVFAFGFVGSAMARTRVQALQAWLWGVLAALALLRGSFALEELRFGRLNGWFAVPGLFGASAAVAVAGWVGYRRKEAVTDGGPLRVPPGWWTGLVAVALALVAVGVLGMWFARNFARIVE